MITNVGKKVIIVGGGTSGAVIARGLSLKFQVTVFEKSNNKRLPYFYKIPLMNGLLWSKKNNYTNNTSIKFNSDRYVPFFESKVLGGASVINGCVHAAGSHVKWTELLGRFNLSRDDLNISYNELYSKIRAKGTINLCEAKEKFIDTVFFEALNELGIMRGDVEWADLSACGLVYHTVSRLFRSSVISLDPFHNCVVKLNHKIERLVVNDELKVVGVFDGSKIFLCDILILCGGVLGTNVLLKETALRLSDKSYVNLGIDAGKGIKDHLNLRVNIESSVKINSLNELNVNYLKKLLLFFKHVLGFKTIMRETGSSSTAHLDLDGDSEIDTRINLLNFAEKGRLGSNGSLFSSSTPAFSISINAIHPKSHGSLILNGQNFFLEPNYLSNKEDMEHLKKSLYFVVNLLESKSFRSVISKIDQLEMIKNNPEEYIIGNSYSGCHLIGGCAHLVDQNFRIDHHGELYVCDASVLADYISSNIHSTIVLLANMFAKKLINHSK